MRADGASRDHAHPGGRMTPYEALTLIVFIAMWVAESKEEENA